MEHANNFPHPLDLEDLEAYKSEMAAKTVREVMENIRAELEFYRSEIIRLETTLDTLSRIGKTSEKVTHNHREKDPSDTRPLRTSNPQAGQGPTRDWLRTVLIRSPGLYPHQIKQIAKDQHLRISKNFPHNMLYEMTKKGELINDMARYSLKKASN